MGFHYNQGDRPLPGYTVQQGVGRGGFGEVYYAQSDGGKEVALKYLRDNPQVELRGVAHCLNLKSPHLVALHDVKENAEGEYFVIMEYVSGPSLRELLNSEQGGLGPQKAAYFLREMCKGLAYLHDRGIVHRDLKPGNIFYEDGYVKIGDYGLAKIMATSQHSGQTVSVGTVHYMAPEVGSGNYDRTIDIYALGVMLYEMLLGRVPFTGATMGEVLMKHLTAQPAVDDLPAPFPRVIRKALEKDPKDRYQTVNEMMSEVFAVEDLSQSVAALDSLSLTRMAAAVSKQVKAEAAVQVAHGTPGPLGTGSSNVGRLGATPAVPPVFGRGPRGARSPRDAYSATPPPIPSPGVYTHDASGKPIRGFTGHFPPKYRLTTGILGVFLGPLGVHRFYTGYTGIGVLQIILTLATGVGGLWGFIEGIRILAGFDFRDSLGRPLLEKEPKASRGADRSGPSELEGLLSDFRDRLRRPKQNADMKGASASRSPLAKTLWAILGVLFLLAACGFVLAGALAPPEWEKVDMGFGPAYYVNMFHTFYGVSGISLAIGVLALWKASHRAGLSPWRRTVRPVLLAAFFAFMVAAFTWSWFFAAGEMQLPGLAALGIAAVLFLFVWLLRGPRLPVLPNDPYWARAWGTVFAGIAVLSVIGMVATLRVWGQEGGKVVLHDRGTFRTVLMTGGHKVPNESGGYSYRYGKFEGQVPDASYSLVPVAAGLLGVLGLGSLSEARYRRRLANLAQKALSENQQ